MKLFGHLTSLLFIFLLGIHVLASRRSIWPSDSSQRPVQITFGPIGEMDPQSSPDGRLLAFAYFHEPQPNAPQIWIMETDRGFISARPLVDNANYNAEFSWSPDGKWLTFLSMPMKGAVLTTQVYKVKLSDGSVTQLTHFPEGTGLGGSTSWSKNDQIVFEHGGDLYFVRPSIGDEAKLLDVRSKMPSLMPSEIRWNPDGNVLAFTGREYGTLTGESKIWIADLETKQIHPVTSGPHDMSASWVDKGHLVFSRGLSMDNLGICILSLDNGLTQCLTKGRSDTSPWAISTRNELFFSRFPNTSNPAPNGSMADGVHIWKLRTGGTAYDLRGPR
jgi:Tol biopolymer transport system component